MNHERGAALAMMIMMALVAAISIYAILFMASGQARQAAFTASSIRARYAAEVGLVWAQQRLQKNPAYCGNPGPPLISGMLVNVVVTGACSGGSDPPKIAVTVVY